MAPAFHSRRGLAADASAVTVIGLSGTLEVLPEAGAASPEAVLRPAVAAMQGARAASGGGRIREVGEQFLLLPPEMADAIVKGGWTLAQAQAFMWQTAAETQQVARSPDDIHLIITGGAGVKMTCVVPGAGGTWCVTRATG